MERYKLAVATGGGLFFAWLGTVWQLALLTFIAMLLDYATGLLAGRANEGINSARAALGIYKKVGLFLLLCTGFFLDGAFNHYIAQGFSVEMPFNLPIGLCVSVWITVTEIVSICENLERLGIPIPKWLTNLLKRTQGKIEAE